MVPFLVPLSMSVLLVTSLNDSSTFLHCLTTLEEKESEELKLRIKYKVAHITD